MAEKRYEGSAPVYSDQNDQSSYPAAPPPYYSNGTENPPQNMLPKVQTVVQHVYTVAPAVGPDPSSLQCPSCRHQVTTRLDFETTTKTHLMAGLLCCFVCWPCAWVPYVMDSCKNANHYCPNCQAYIGTYKQ